MFATRLLAAALLAAAAGAALAAPEQWTLTLSWSPQYCKDHVGSKEPQCTGEHYFLVQNLLPSAASGLELDCETAAFPQDEALLRLMPLTQNRAELRQLWRRYGSCIGGSFESYATQVDYASRKAAVPPAYAQVHETLKTTPQEVRAQFIALNPGMSEAHLALRCSGGYLRTLSVCFDRNMGYRACGPDTADTCGPNLKLRSVPASRRER